MKYRIVQMVDGRMVATEPKDIFAWAEVVGTRIAGVHHSKSTRLDLQGQPVLRGFAGPMWDDGHIRYEDAETNDTLSR